MRVDRSLLAGLSALFWAFQSQAWVLVDPTARLKLEDLLSGADVVVVGRDIGESKEGVSRVKEFQIRDVLRGDNIGVRLYYLSGMSSSCGSSSGDRQDALLFLHAGGADHVKRVGRTVYSSFGGLGRMPIRSDANARLVGVTMAPVGNSDSFPSIEMDSWDHDICGWVALPELEAAVRDVPPSLREPEAVPAREPKAVSEVLPIEKLRP